VLLQLETLRQAARQRRLDRPVAAGILRLAGDRQIGRLQINDTGLQRRELVQTEIDTAEPRVARRCAARYFHPIVDLAAGELRFGYTENGLAGLLVRHEA